MKVVPLVCGHALARAIFLGRGGLEMLRLPARLFLIEHPERGRLLIDTGYGPGYWRATRKFPFRLMRWLIPADIPGSARELTGPVDAVVVSHWHPDHVGSLDGYADCRVLGDVAELQACRKLSKMQQMQRGFLPDLVPERSYEDLRALPRHKLPAGFEEFADGYDLFGDASCLAVDLPGHLNSHFGFLVETSPRTLLVTDACYHLDELRSDRRLPWLTRRINQSPRQFGETQARLRRLVRNQPELQLWASHHA